MEPERRNYCTYCDDYGHDALDHSDPMHHEYGGEMCVCGHYEVDHHRSWFAITKYTPNGGKLVEECEYWGHAETGGMEYTIDGRWIGHCDKFKRADT